MSRTPRLLDIVRSRRGHFLLESGYHGGLWLDLETLFLRPSVLMPFVLVLAEHLRPYNAEAVCGPMAGGAFLAQMVAAELGCEFWYAERTKPAASTELYSARYALPSSLASRAAGKRVAIVDDAMSAGSSLRATYGSLKDLGAETCAVGALLVLGSRGRDFFAEQRVPIESVAYEAYEFWTPDDCPECRAGTPLENSAA